MIIYAYRNARVCVCDLNVKHTKNEIIFVVIMRNVLAKAIRVMTKWCKGNQKNNDKNHTCVHKNDKSEARQIYSHIFMLFSVTTWL